MPTFSAGSELFHIIDIFLSSVCPFWHHKWTRRLTFPSNPGEVLSRYCLARVASCNIQRTKSLLVIIYCSKGKTMFLAILHSCHHSVKNRMEQCVMSPGSWNQKIIIMYSYLPSQWTLNFVFFVLFCFSFFFLWKGH